MRIKKIPVIKSGIEDKKLGSITKIFKIPKKEKKKGLENRLWVLKIEIFFSNQE